MNSANQFAPPGWPTLIPRLVVSQPQALVEFVRRVFAGNGNYHEDRPTELWIGDSLILVSGDIQREPANGFLYVYVADVEYAYREALRLGALCIEAPKDLPYGDRRAMVKDPWGNHWQIAARTGG